MAHEFESEPETTRIQSIEQIDFNKLKEGSIKLEKSPRVPEPTEWGMGLEEDAMFSLNKGAEKVYRDQRSYDSIQVREYEDYYLIQRDHANPAQGKIVEHYKYDVSPGQKLALGIAVIAVAGIAFYALAS